MPVLGLSPQPPEILIICDIEHIVERLQLLEVSDVADAAAALIRGT